ncbi:unnamed protein product, partial [Rotaria sordida]
MNIDWSDSSYLTHDDRLHSMTRFERRQACYYQAKIQQIRQQLRNENLILRPIYKDIGYHVDRSYPTASQNRLVKIVERVETTLNNLLHSKSITEAQHMTMKIDRST